MTGAGVCRGAGWPGAPNVSRSVGTDGSSSETSGKSGARPRQADAGLALGVRIGHVRPSPVLVDVPAPADLTLLSSIARECGATVDFAKEMTRPYGRVWIARDDPGAAPCSFMVAWIAGDDLEIIDVGTARRARRRGGARALVRQAIDHARQTGLRGLTLEVRQSNAPAQGLYASAGFERVAEREAYYADTGETAWILRFDLPHRNTASAVSTAPDLA